MLNVITSDDQLIEVDPLFTIESSLIQTLLEFNENEIDIKLHVPYEYMKHIYEYMIHTYNTDIDTNINNIEYPCIEKVSHYLQDDWYDEWLDKFDICSWRNIYNSCDYLGMKNLCRIIVAHVGYMANNNYYDLTMSSDNIKQVYNVNMNQFENMTDEDIIKYLEDERKKWM